jgi:hypothetical protein
MALHEAGIMVGQELVRQAQIGILSTEKTGRHYPALANQSSAPGEFSANQSGALLNSIDFRVEGDDLIAFFATSEHAGYQEYGTSKMAPRPNLEMAIEQSDDTIKSILEQLIWRALGGD